MAKKILTTGIGAAVYPYITRPDTKGKFADGKFKTSLVLDKADDLKVFQDAVKAWMEGEKFGVKKPKLPWSEDDDGNIKITAKSKYRPVVKDAKRNEIPEEALEDLWIRGGSKLRIAVELFNYDEGVSLRLKTVQVLELASGGDDFDDVDDGFTYDASKVTKKPKPAQKDDDEDADDDDDGL